MFGYTEMKRWELLGSYGTGVGMVEVLSMHAFLPLIVQCTSSSLYYSYSVFYYFCCCMFRAPNTCVIYHPVYVEILFYFICVYYNVFLAIFHYMTRLINYTSAKCFK